MNMYDDPKVIQTDRWFTENIDKIERYIHKRIRGYDRGSLFVDIFGPECQDSALFIRVRYLEEHPRYEELRAKALGDIKLSDLWDAKTSVSKLLRLVNGSDTRDSSRLNAIKELNVMFDITIVDETGKTRRGSAMADFYKDINAAINEGNEESEE